MPVVLRALGRHLPFLLLLTAGVSPLATPAAAQTYVDPSFSYRAAYTCAGAPFLPYGAMAQLPDGRFIVGSGECRSVNGVPGRTIMRLNVDGSVDPTFVPTIVDQAGNPAGLAVVATQPDGKILAVGNFSSVNGVASGTFIRLNADGSRDQTFNPPIIYNDWPRALIVLDDGRILLSNLSLGLVRLTTTGALDPTFTPLPTAPDAVALQVDGKIVISGSFDSIQGVARRRFARLHPSGLIDESFTPPPAIVALPSINSLAVRPDGRILATGWFENSAGSSNIELRLYNADGSRVDAFQVQFTGGGVPPSVKAHPDGRAVLDIVYGFVNGAPAQGVVRITAEGQLDTQFPIGGTFLLLQSDGKILVAAPPGSGGRAVRYFPEPQVTPGPGAPLLTGSFASNPITLTWAPGTGSAPTAYTLHAGTAPGASNLGSFAMGVATQIVAPIPAGLRIWARVVATNAFGSAQSNEVDFVLGGVVAPGAPTLSAVQVAANPVTLAWTAGAGGAPQRYVLHAGTAPGASNFGVFDVGLAASISGAVPPGVPTFVRVVAQNVAGSAASNEISFTVGGAVAAPVLAPPLVGGSTVTLSWSGVAGATFELVARSTPTGAVLLTAPVGGVNSVSVPGVASGTYFVTVRARVGATTSPESNQIAVSVP